METVAGKAKERWGKLTDDDWQQVAGKREQLVGKIQERYGVTKEVAEEQVRNFFNTLSDKAQAASKSR
jgi:uncharacterized protein YjbJ (UPF0337 family)